VQSFNVLITLQTVELGGAICVVYQRVNSAHSCKQKTRPN